MDTNPTVKFDDATFASIQQRFKEGRPKESSKRKRRSRCDLIISLHDEIEKLLNDGHSFDGIAEYLASLGVVIPVTTLQNYVGRARRKAGTTRSARTQRRGDTAESSSRMEKRRPPRSTGTTRETSSPAAPTAASHEMVRATESPSSAPELVATEASSPQGAGSERNASPSPETDEGAPERTVGSAQNPSGSSQRTPQPPTKAPSVTRPTAEQTPSGADGTSNENAPTESDSPDTSGTFPILKRKRAADL